MPIISKLMPTFQVTIFLMNVKKWNLQTHSEILRVQEIIGSYPGELIDRFGEYPECGSYL